VKLCECGCGEPAPIAPKNNTKRGYVKGQPFRFVVGHNPPSEHFRERARESVRGPLSAEALERIAESKRGAKHPLWQGDAANYRAVHKWLCRNYPKAGRCDRCGREARTEYAFLAGGRNVTRNREDYAELCRSCHVKHDWQLRAARATDQPAIRRTHP
jgi:hypothetical protein